MRFWRWLSSSASAAVVLGYAAALPAQEKDAAAASGDQASWAFSYLLVVLLVALGLMAICRPGSRTSELKRTGDDEE